MSTPAAQTQATRSNESHAHAGADAPSGLALTLETATVAVTAGALRRGSKTILDQASVHIAPGQFVGILGASGSGKSTLIKAMAGLIELTGGEVRIDGRPCSAGQLLKDRRIAYLPQDVVIHEALTSRRALEHIAQLKGLAGRREAVRRVADRVGLSERLDVPIRRLSGGQRKRVALAAELLGDPRLILLDEATSGLDPASEADMMRLFRSLADEGRTVVCITHFPERLALCDKLIYLMQGKLIFAGPPQELQALFGTSSIEEVYLAQASRPAEAWRAQFDQSPAGHRHGVIQRAARTLVPANEPASRPDSSALSQFITLTRRYTRLQAADPLNLLLLFIQAPIIALLIGISYGNIRVDFAEMHAAKTKEVSFLLMIAILWCSGTAAVREIVKERAILQHESRFGVNLLPYLLSKVGLLAILGIAQAVLLLLIVKQITSLTGDTSTQLLVLGIAAVVGITLGLLVSAVVRSSEQAMTVLPVLLIMQAILSGGLARLEDLVKLFAQITVPAYWILDGLRAIFDPVLTFATYPNAPGHFQPAILGTGGPLWLDLTLLSVHGLAILAVGYLLLHKQVHGRWV